MAADPSLPSVGWSWLTDALDAHGSGYIAASGSVTVVHTEGFGEMAADGSDAQIEVRASWTPDVRDMGAHIGRVVRPAVRDRRPAAARARRHPPAPQRRRR